MGVIKCDIKIVVNSLLLCTPSVVIYYNFKIYYFGSINITYLIYNTLVGTELRVLSTLGVICRTNNHYHWVFRVDFWTCFKERYFSILYNFIFQYTWCMFGNYLKLLLDDNLFSNIYQNIWGVYIKPNFDILWFFAIFYQHTNLWCTFICQLHLVVIIIHPYS